MEITDYVSDESATQARTFEKKFQSLTADAGIIFVSVRPMPCANGSCKKFEVRLGVSKSVGESAGRSLVRYVMKEEIDRGLTILANVYQGVSGAASGDTGDGTSGTDSP